jgi:hypothetical protein
MHWNMTHRYIFSNLHELLSDRYAHHFSRLQPEFTQLLPNSLAPAKPNSYKFDVDPASKVFLNRRIFAFVDTGVPDGVNVDEQGNVYSGCGDGVHVRVHGFLYPFNL